MPRPLERFSTPSKDTADRLAVLDWKGDLRLEDIGDRVGRSKQWVSKWLKHRAELLDTEIPRWEQVTGISKRVFLDGRFESRNRFSSRNEAAA